MSFQRVGDVDHFLACREWFAMRMQALERDGGKCACCGRTARDVIMNVDHIKPRAFYPELALTLSNLQVLCSQCNAGKGNKFETNWRVLGATPSRAATGTTKEEAERARQIAEVRRMTKEAADAEPLAKGSVLHESADKRGGSGSPGLVGKVARER